MLDVEKFKFEFKNMKMGSDLMVKYDDVQKLIDEYLTKSMYYVVSDDDGNLLKIEKPVETRTGLFECKFPHFVSGGDGTHFGDLSEAAEYLIDQKDRHIETRYE